MNEIVQGYISTVLTERATGAPSPYDQDTGMSRSFLPYRGTAPASSPAAAAIAAAFSERDDAVYRGDLVVTGIGTDVRDRFGGMPRSVTGAISGTGLGPFAALGAAMSSNNLTRIQEKQRAGEEGYAVGMLNGRIVGVSPGIGGPVLSGMLPEGISVKQRQSIAQQLLEMSGSRFQPDEGIGGSAADNPNLKTGRTYSETRFGAGTYEGGTIPPDSINPSAFVMGIPPAGDRGDDPSSIRFINIGADRPDPNYRPSLNTFDYYGDPGGDTGPAPTGGATTPRDDSDRDQPRNEYSIGGGGSNNPADRGYSMMADGGTVQGTGFVSGSPDNYTKAQTVADDENRQVREGAFVLNAPTTEKLQKAGLLPTGVDNSGKNTTIKASKGGLMDVALSKGEYVIEPEEAQRIGYSFLEQLNNGGKAEVDRRQAAADGGFIKGYAEGGELPLAKIELSDATKNKFNTFLKSRRQRADVERLIDNMDDRERLAVLALAETTAATDSVESMMGVGQTAINRARTNRPSFSKVNDLASVMKQRSSRGSGSKMFQYDGLEPGILSKRLKEVMEGRVPGAVTKTFSAADNLLNP